MDGAQIHLAINHFPLILTLCGIVIIIIAHVRKHPFLFRTGALFLLVGAVTAIPTYLSGEPAEDVIEGYPDVTEVYIEAHEEAAVYTFIVTEILGLAALVALALTRKTPDYKRGLSITLLLLSLIAVTSIARTSHLGGQIRHQELRSGADTTTTSPPTEAEEDD